MSNTVNRSKTVVIIPAYEPSHAFVDYAKLLLAKGFGGLVVVDDGSGEKYADIFNELSALESCTVISYTPNHGKGYALKTAFQHCKDTYDDGYVFVTADCDGQHLAHDVESVANTANAHRSKLILGARDFSLDNVPARSKAGNINIRRMFKFFYGLSLSDTQTGLRAFSYSLLEKLISIKGDRFEYEMNMLIVFHKSHIEILEVPIETVYEKKADDVEKVSHFKTFSDSAKVMMTLFQNLGWYVISSFASAVIDIVAFFFLINYLPVSKNVLFATVGARIISSIVNFTINFKVVFNGKSAKSIFKYYVLWTVQLGASYGLATTWNIVFSSISALTPTQINLFTTLAKGVCDLLLALLSYQIQSHWVFVSVEHSRLHFYGLYFRFALCFYGFFNKKYTSFVIPDEKEPAVYISRHLNTPAARKIVHSTSFNLHVFALHDFFRIRLCRKYCSEYTFNKKHSKRGVFGKLIANIKAFLAAIVVVPGMHSAKAIPVHRGDLNDSAITLRKTLKYLDKRENVLVFPDPDYASGKRDETDINTAFLQIEKLYYKKHGKHIEFKVLEVNDEKCEITEIGSVTFPDYDDFAEAMPEISQRVKDMLAAK